MEEKQKTQYKEIDLKNELATAVQIPPHMPRHVTDDDSSETVQRTPEGAVLYFF